MRRSVDLVVGMYAVVAAGGAYVPLDPDQPAERNGHILGTAAPVCVLSTAGDGVVLPGEFDVVLIDDGCVRVLGCAIGLRRCVVRMLR
ncbi:AMP-binding protein [Rhodococcus erythropolis]|uniref:AMP-binding protein n=1 Tax=Rhodococcus erythropolis TaxID=1833 RepID=UPI003873C666